MNQLHALFTLRNQRAFQRLLDGSVDRGQLSSAPFGGSSSGKSWNRSGASLSTICDVNAQDWLGRTVLHLACATNDPSVIEYVKLLLAHPAINVNLCDTESNWTALHRALYQGNIPAALLLLQRSDTDIAVKDFEGYTAFDLYNSTIEGTKSFRANLGRAELFTWGSNRNASLGLGDEDDRTHPELVAVPFNDDLDLVSRGNSDIKLHSVDVREVVMSKFQTAVVTHEDRGNLCVCGFGSGGRLGPIQHTQYSLKHIPRFTHTVVSVALGQDHTLALTISGEVLSWGSNRFSQLGYLVESPLDSASGFGRSEEPIQSFPRRVHGPLKKEFVCGVAASKFSSACWTSREVFTWGTNFGQLGYDMLAHPVQILPRRVAKISSKIVSISITDFATACLSAAYEVFCIWNDKVIKINFPSRFPAEIQVNWSPHVSKYHGIRKITSCDDVFAALSRDGELFIFNVPKPSQTETVGLKPQRVWALRKKFSSVKDVALGDDGTIIICTDSGHVFCRSRSTKSGSIKTSKFQRIPVLQRVTNVCANNAGAFGAIRGDFKPQPVSPIGNSLVQDIADLQPYLCLPHSPRSKLETPLTVLSCHPPVVAAEPNNLELDDDEEDTNIHRHIKMIEQLYLTIVCNKPLRGGGAEYDPSGKIHLEHGADLIIETQQGLELPAHRVILASRCPVLEEVLSHEKTIQTQDICLSLGLAMPALSRLLVKGCHPLSLLFLLAYLYTDELPVVWDPRVAPAFEQALQDLGTSSKQVNLDLQVLVRVLNLTSLFRVVDAPSATAPSPSLTHDITFLLDQALDLHSASHFMRPKSPLVPDVVLRLADNDISCHSTILRARSAFFADFFDEPDWTVNRWNADGTICVDMTHMTDRVVRFILRYIYCDDSIFAKIGSNHSVDDFLEFAFEVMGAANEFLLDRLVGLCSTAILEHVNVRNACYILSEATYFNAMPLVESIHGYIAANMETFLESGMFDDMPGHLIQNLAAFVHRKQNEKSPVQRSQLLIQVAMKNQSEWLALQDIPQPIICRNVAGLHQFSPKLSPSSQSKRQHHRPSVESPSNSPSIRPRASSQNLHLSENEIFVMDGLRPPSPPRVQRDVSSITEVQTISAPRTAWKATSAVPRIDMKTLMAEAASSKLASTQPVVGPRANASVGGMQVESSQGPQRKEKFKRQEISVGDTYEWRVTTPLRPSPLTESPWRKSPALSAPGTSSHIETPHLGQANIQSSGPASSFGMSSKARLQPHPYPTQPSLGPTISPLRQAPSSISSSRRSSGKAWTLPSVQPTIQPSLAGTGPSLVAIQEMELGQGAVVTSDKRSLLEIQEEEQARRTEAEFLRWWSAEEQRLREEEQVLSQVLEQTKPPKKQKKLRGKAVLDRVSSAGAPQSQENHPQAS